MSSCVDAVDVEGGGVGDEEIYWVGEEDDAVQAVYDHIESCDLVVKFGISLKPWNRCKELIAEHQRGQAQAQAQ